MKLDPLENPLLVGWRPQHHQRTIDGLFLDFKPLDRDSAGLNLTRIGGYVHIDRRTFAKTLSAGALGGLFRPWNSPVWAQAAQARTPAPVARAAAGLPKAIVTKIRAFV